MEKESLSLDDEISALLTSSSSGILSHEDRLTLNMPRSKKSFFGSEHIQCQLILMSENTQRRG